VRKTLIAATAALLTLAIVPVANAQAPGATVDVKLSPSKAGTKKKPKATKLTLKLANEDPSQTADGIKVFIGKNVKAATKGLKTCSAAKLEANGPGACPAGSKVGTGSADAIAGVNTSRPASIKFDITAVVIGKDKLGFYLSQRGGDINVLSTGTLKKASGKYGQVLDISIPQLAREFPTGTYNGLVGLETTLYKKAGKKSLFSLAGCSGKKVPFELQMHFMNNPAPPKAVTVTATGAAACK
jgi:hypothetical protein